MAKLLIPLAQNLDEPDPNGWTPLQRAASYKQNKEIVRILIPLVENLKTPDPLGWTLLQRAVKFRWTEIARILRDGMGRDWSK